MTGPLPRPGRTGVRTMGDHYQWLHAWSECVAMLLPTASVLGRASAEAPVVAVGVEIDGAGNVDDVVLHRAAGPDRHAQVKWTVDASTPVGLGYLSAVGADGGPSLLAKLASSWQMLEKRDGKADLALVTNRLADPGDELIAGLDGRTRLLMPRAGEGTARSKRGKARLAWAAAAGLSGEELLRLLSALRFDIGLSLGTVIEIAALRMALAGMRSDKAAVDAGGAWIAEQVRNGQRRLTPDMIRAAADQLDLGAVSPWAAVSVATLKPDPSAGDAVHALDWADRFDGADAYAKRRPLPPATWAELQRDLDGLADVLAGTPRVAFTGSMRQATAFTAGAALRMVTGTDVAVVQRGELWQSDAAYDAPAPVDVEVREIGQGPDVAIAIEVATSLADDVEEFVRRTALSVGRLVVLRPAAGPSDRAVADGAGANALAAGLRDASRGAARGAGTVRLFLAGPMGLALLLGHRWNRVAPTVVYEDLAQAGYEAAFTVSA